MLSKIDVFFLISVFLLPCRYISSHMKHFWTEENSQFVSNTKNALFFKPKICKSVATCFNNLQIKTDVRFFSFLRCFGDVIWKICGKHAQRLMLTKFHVNFRQGLDNEHAFGIICNLLDEIFCNKHIVLRMHAQPIARLSNNVLSNWKKRKLRSTTAKKISQTLYISDGRCYIPIICKVFSFAGTCLQAISPHLKQIIRNNMRFYLHRIPHNSITVRQ